MDRTVMWMQWNNLGMEQLHIENNQNGISADGVVVGIKEGRPYRIRYEIDADQSWKVRRLQIKSLNAAGQSLMILSDTDGQWQRDAEPIAELTGCIDVDLSATPFTNTLAVRRLGLQPGSSQEILVAYITVPDLQFRAVPQRYTCLEINSQGSIYKYEALWRNFAVELMVDRDGLVIEYPKAFRRVWSVEEPR